MLLHITHKDSWLIVKGLAAYMIFGQPTKEEYRIIVRILTQIEEGGVSNEEPL
jgi:hypothetical protein